MLHDTALAQDTAQDTFLRVWRSLGRYDSRAGAFSTWIYAIARNRCLSVLDQSQARLQRACTALHQALERRGVADATLWL